MKDLTMKFYSNRSPKKGYSWENGPAVIPEDQIVETLIEEAMKIAESMGESDGENAGTGGPMVTVS